MKIRLLVLSLFASSFAFAADIKSLAPTVVTATRVETNSFDLPVSIDVVSKSNIQDAQLKMTLSESLIRIPGITAQSRSQFSQDPQISTRGFGSRSSFGVRGLRIYVDSIPFSMPDGIGQPGNIDLGSIKAMEVMRGPFSSLYGNSSGGVVQLLTEDAPKTPEIGSEFMTGSYGTSRQNAKATGSVGNVDYLINFSNFETDGYRQNSNAKKEQFTAKLKINISNSTRLTMLANWMDMDAQDPLGLARTASSGSGPKTTYAGASVTVFERSAFDDPTAIPSVASLANTRVSRKNQQIGFNLEHAFNENNSVNIISYVGKRDNLQYLSAFSSTATTTPTMTADFGRASGISRDFWGTEFRYTNKGQILDRAYQLTGGINYGNMEDNRSDINAYSGVMLDSSSLANVNRREINIAKNFDQYLQAQYAVANSIDIHAGIRRTKVDIKVQDNLVDLAQQSTIAKYRDSSGKLSYEKTTPVVGAVWKINPMLNLYANYGKGFETPNLIEIAYDNVTNGTGPNLNLTPSQSDNYEIGAKAFANSSTRINAAIFRTNTDKEIVVASSGTYTTYQNAGKTKRQGIEASIDSQLANNFGIYGAYTFLDAKFDSTFSSAGNTVNSGNTIPGTYRQQIYGEVSWKYPELGFYTALETRYNSKVYVNDRNTDYSDSYTVVNLRAGFQQSVSNWKFSEFLRVENIADKDYIGSIRVNDTNNRFFEPSPGRNWMVGVNANYRF
ncbi:TonB-dependent receptor family protein [Candidatus Methylopumilus planktonicus]|uniref:TonB-dependent receptor family protein n=1 Tax=Candidatus Methylopumilus planktonicus TaxID=1581557 RepID=UPI003BEF3537